MDNNSSSIDHKLGNPLAQKKKVNWVKVSLAVVGGVIIFAGGVFVGMRYFVDAGIEEKKVSLPPIDVKPINRKTSPTKPVRPVQEEVEHVQKDEASPVPVGLQEYSSESLGLRFSHPSSWSVAEEEFAQGTGFRLRISKGDYAIEFVKIPSGPGACIYDGTESEGPSVQLGAYTDLVTKDGLILRRSVPEDGGSVICQQSEGTGTYINWTSFGYIAYELPVNFDPAKLQELDAIVKTLSVN